MIDWLITFIRQILSLGFHCRYCPLITLIAIFFRHAAGFFLHFQDAVTLWRRAVAAYAFCAIRSVDAARGYMMPRCYAVDAERFDAICLRARATAMARCRAARYSRAMPPMFWCLLFDISMLIDIIDADAAARCFRPDDIITPLRCWWCWYFSFIITPFDTFFRSSLILMLILLLLSILFFHDIDDDYFSCRFFIIIIFVFSLYLPIHADAWLLVFIIEYFLHCHRASYFTFRWS